MGKVSKNNRYDVRTRYLIQDLIELREKNFSEKKKPTESRFNSYSYFIGLPLVTNFKECRM